ncbi:MAG: pilus assembly protein PilM [Sedimentisphaerales bacterium]|nr:pilus assembly protein PilM [Sedimentisphaerales bacterium]
MDFKKTINLKQNDVIGLDIGSSAVKIIVLNKDSEGYKIKAAGIAEIAADSENNSNYSRETYSRNNTNIVNAIRDCCTAAGLKIKTKQNTNLAVCGVNGPEVAVRDFAFPTLPDEEIESAITLEAEVVCPFNAGQAAIDYQLMSNSDGKTKGIFVAATNNLIANQTQYAKEAGLKCVLMDVDGLAMLNCFNGLADSRDKQASAILNVGASCTTLAILNKEGWPFIRDTSCAGEDIISQIINDVNISRYELFSILFNDSKEMADEIKNSMEKASEQLITGVSEALRFYAAQEKSVPVQKIFVCGGFASASGFISLLNCRFGAEVVLWNPFGNIRCEASQECRDILNKTGHSMVVAAGLAMRTV